MPRWPSSTASPRPTGPPPTMATSYSSSMLLLIERLPSGSARSRRMRATAPNVSSSCCVSGTLRRLMRGKGVVYDTGFLYAGGSSRDCFDRAVVERELHIIRDDLHCNAVRVTGGDPDRLEIAATLAAAAGLEVWFSPFTGDQTPDELLALLDECAARASAGKSPTPQSVGWKASTGHRSTSSRWTPIALWRSPTTT